MQPSEFLALCVLIAGVISVAAIIGNAYKRRLAFMERKLELMARPAADPSPRDTAHTERLESRVRVLERIATDKRGELAEQIENLRDPALN